jgi:hypothetical protein
MTIKRHLSLPADAPETYEELARLYVLRRIHDKIGQQNATEVVDWLAVLIARWVRRWHLSRVSSSSPRRLTASSFISAGWEL